jgi:hypothetical protein
MLEVVPHLPVVCLSAAAVMTSCRKARHADGDAFADTTAAEQAIVQKKKEEQERKEAAGQRVRLSVRVCCLPVACTMLLLLGHDLLLCSELSFHFLVNLVCFTCTLHCAHDCTCELGVCVSAKVNFCIR